VPRLLEKSAGLGRRLLASTSVPLLRSHFFRDTTCQRVSQAEPSVSRSRSDLIMVPDSIPT
jgi:hypothetical protein